MKNYDEDQSYQQTAWDENAEYTDEYTDGSEDYGAEEDYGDDPLDEELDQEHNFRIAMNVFDLISMLVGLAVVLALAGLLFSLFNWAQRDISQSLSVLAAPFR